MNNKELADKLEEMAETLKLHDDSLIYQAAQALRGEESGVPRVGQGYCYIDNAGSIGWAYWNDDLLDRRRLAIGNVYLKHEKASTIDQNRKTLVKLRKFGCKDGCSTIRLFKDRNLDIQGSARHYGELVRFATRDIAQQALEAVGEDKVKQLIEHGVL